MTKTQKNQAQYNIIKYFQKNGIIPIIINNQIQIYKIKTTIKTKELIEKYKNLYDINTCLYNPKSPIVKTKTPPADNILSYHRATSTEFIEYLNLTSKQIKSIRDKYKKEIEETKRDKKQTIKIYRDETTEEVIKRIASYHLVINYIKESKISQILSYIYSYSFYNLDFIISNIYNFLYNQPLEIEKKTTPIETEIEKEPFTQKEQSLNQEEKINIIKEIIETLEIKCICQYNINEHNNIPIKLGHFQYNEIEKITIQYAKNNTTLLNKIKINNIVKQKILNKIQNIK